VDFDAVVEFHVDLAGQDEVDVDGVRGVHAGVVRLEHVEQAGDVPLDLAGRGGRVEVVRQGRGARAEGEEAEPEPAGRREAGARLRRLEADGLVRRVPHARDRRTTLAEITSDGRKVVIPIS
jgi:hypothetical protein